MTIGERSQLLPGVLEQLLETPAPASGVLSVYLDTRLGPEGMGRPYLVTFEDSARALREEVPAELRKAFDTVVKRARAYLETIAPGGPGVAVFASEKDYFFATPLPARPANVVRFAAEPVLTPLEAAVDDLERVAVVLFDSERTRLFTIALGEIEEHTTFLDDVPGKQDSGGWFGLSQKRYERHREDHLLRHAKRTIAALLRELQRHPFDRLLIAGPDEPVALLEDHLPRPLRTRRTGTLRLELSSPATPTSWPRHGKRWWRSSGGRKCRRCADCSMPPARRGSRSVPRRSCRPSATGGCISSTWGMASADRARSARPAAPCCPVRSLCPRCGAATRPVADLRERAAALMIAKDGRVEFVSGEAAALLAPHGEIAARTRWG